MLWAFTKMQGCGNDYIYFDCFDREFPQPEEKAVMLSRAHFGVGGDGIILIDPSDTADARRRIFNQDGSEGRMCGNGIRCVGKYLYDSGRAKKDVLRVETKSGIKVLQLSITDGKAESVRVDMGPASFRAKDIPVLLPEEEAVEVLLECGGKSESVTCVSMGNPHCVLFRSDVQHLDIQKEGSAFEHHPVFPERTNTEFVQILDRRHVRMRVWERGSGETLACGTGACASVAAAVRCGYCDDGEEITVHLLGGDLKIVYTPATVWMEGEARTVFRGEIDL